MPKRTEYEDNVEAKEIAKKIIEMYPADFGHIKIDQLCCRTITNKERKPGKNYWELKSVKDPMQKDCTFVYYITVYAADWTSIEDTQKALIMIEAMMGILEDGDLMSFDVKTYGKFLRTFGIDAMTNDKIVNPLLNRVIFNS
jgi:hypothetical protein